MTSFSVSNKPFITSMLLDEVQVLLFDFATSIQSGHEPFKVCIYTLVPLIARCVIMATLARVPCRFEAAPDWARVPGSPSLVSLDQHQDAIDQRLSLQSPAHTRCLSFAPLIVF